MLMHPRRNQRGFTLIELMIVVLILSILLGVGIPSFREAFATQRVKTAAKTLFSAIKQARSEAIRLNGICEVYLVPNAATNWADGLQILAVTTGGNPATFAANPAANPCVFTDNTGTGNITYNNPLAIFTAQEYVRGTPAAALANIQFNRLGRPTAAPPNIGFCDDDNLAPDQWTVEIDAAGLPRYSSDGTCP